MEWWANKNALKREAIGARDETNKQRHSEQVGCCLIVMIAEMQFADIVPKLLLLGALIEWTNIRRNALRWLGLGGAK